MGKVTAYVATLCPFAQRTRITILAKGVEHEWFYIDNDVLLRRKPKPQILLDKNPLGAVPVIDHEGMTLYESSIIGEYLEEAFKDQGPTLMPADVKERSLARLHISQIQGKVLNHLYAYMFSSDDKREEMREKFMEGLKWAQDKFEERPGDFFLGNELSLVDIAYVPFFERIVTTMDHIFQMNHLESVPKLNQWYHETMHTVDAFLQTKSDPQYLLDCYKVYIELNKK